LPSERYYPGIIVINPTLNISTSSGQEIPEHEVKQTYGNVIMAKNPGYYIWVNPESNAQALTLALPANEPPVDHTKTPPTPPLCM